MRKRLMEGEHVPRVYRKSTSTYQPVDPVTLEIYVAKVDRIPPVDLVTNGG